jgi:Flp pilus assembly protein TadG
LGRRQVFWRDRRGNVAVIVALSLPLVIAGAGFGVEVGFWRFDQVRLQQAADAAAYAAAVMKRSGGDNLTDTATTTAASNGYASATDSLAVHTPSTATPSDANSVEVVISRTESPYFTGMFTSHTTQVRVSATASYTTAADACILALDHSAAKAANFAGNSSLTLSGCTVMSNSMATNALNVQGSAVVSVPCMYAVGGASLGGTTTLTSCAAVKTGQPPVADPYKSLAMPTVSGSCQNQNNSGSLSAGHYCSLTFKKNTTLASGVYIVDGGSLTINAGAVVSGSGVTFYLVNGASVSMNGNSDVQLTAPTTGTYAGMLFISDRSNTGSLSINGDNSSTVTGVIYAPKGSVTYNGNFSGAGGCTQIVAGTVAWSGSTTFKDDCSGTGMDSVKMGGVVRLSA